MACPRAFSATGGWYIDEAVALAVADAGYVDCTATDVRPTSPTRPHERGWADRPGWFCRAAKRLLELPTTHGLRRLLRTPPRMLPPIVHFYFHDSDLVSVRRRMAIVLALRMLGRLRRPRALDEVAAQVGPTAPALSWAEVAA